MEHLSAGLTTIIAATSPLLLALVAPLVLRERLTAARIAGLVVGFGGVAFVMSYRLSGGHGHIDTLGGAIRAALGVVSLVAATVLDKRWTPTEHPLVVNTVQPGAAGPATLVAALLVEHAQRVHLTVPLALAVLYLVVAVSIVASLLWFWLLTRGDASAVSSYYFLAPIVGLILSAVLLREPLSIRDILGLIPVAAGIILINRPASPRPVPAVRQTQSGSAHVSRDAAR